MVINKTENLIHWMSKIPHFNNQYAQAGLIVLLFLIAAFILTWITKVWLSKIAKKTKTKWDDVLVAKIRPPFSYIMLFVGIKLALKPLNFTNKYIISLLDTIVILTATAIAVITVEVILEVWAEHFAKKTKSDIDDELLPMFKKFSKVAIWVIGIVIVLGVWGVNITPMLASLGVVGLVLGFALKDSLANIFGGVSLILDRAIKVGDKVKLQSGELGIVIDIGLRSTRLRTFDNESIVIPNGQLANSRIQNFTQPTLKQRIVVNFNVEYGTNPDEVKKLILPIITKIKNIIKEPAPDVIFTEMGDSALVFQARMWVEDQSQAFDAKLEATEKIYNALNKAKIGIPFPTRTVYLKNWKIGKER
ncbi:hypothetical protein DRJ17_01125 [Candidatus Woesearchaeota archaeon]|nr:MAG: hypothetical protein DRJ17_01125 [Candidatus Woesearchaeota archaeon]